MTIAEDTIRETPTHSASSERIVDMHDVRLEFQPGVGVFDLSLYVPDGAVFGLVGPSGSGKTTTVRLMLGVYHPDEGEIQVLGEEPARFHNRTRERVGYMPQQFILYPELTVRENLNFVASLYGISWFQRGKRIDEMLELVELKPAEKRLASKLSGGMQRRLQLAAALLNRPRLLFADEPTAGIDPELRSRVWDYLQEYRAQGNTLFITTQYVNEAAYCDLVAVMRAGRLMTVDTPEGLRRRALGGEVIALTVAPERTLETVRLLEREPGVLRTHRIGSQPGRIHVYVENSGEMLPDIISLFARGSDIDIQQAEKYEPPFDDIFRILMQQEDERDLAEVMT
ncbi:MAG TPA: ABC transporter ATP-binding protein [Aggregatilineales bacterium]|jgi:ABC-2 type transport system ATP-binding protein|nr:ABC transporter ATP-binding protein [Chloroflexota bacterium]HOA24845.1 ABC transporter ATP-binding protein [Aggregatilineales bacterium]HPV07207.1 ABC transporter ATP-binding protein [Aggregatilineales bacterium]HQA67065.1 ABC transporter ATP-binding protein [Aggregatilineales bacterium]HQE18084.1 ABC transporter ATP-binding protein [Aggregatilineales bacterium]